MAEHSLNDKKIAALIEEADNLSAENFDKANELYRQAMEKANKLFVDASDSSATGILPSLDATGLNGAPEDQRFHTAEMALRLQESAFCGLIRLYRIYLKAKEMRNLVVEFRDFLSTLKKVRTAKLVRTLIDAMSKIPNTVNLQVELCEECIQWCKEEKRTFLRHRVEARLCLLYMQQGKLQLAFELVGRLLKEVKKLDDKLLLVEIHLIESKLYLNVKNIAKSKAALTACRTNANAIHCSPLIQGDIDMQSGILHSYEKNYKTAFSYFFEAFEAFSSITPAAHVFSSMSTFSKTGTSTKANIGDIPVEDNKALLALKYMMLAKIMCGQPEEISSLLSVKYGLKYANEKELEALRAVAVCYKERSLKLFEDTLEKYAESLKGDVVIEKHVNELYDALLEQNILRVLEAFSRIEISHIAELMELPVVVIQRKLCEMILDGKLQGTLDQGIGVLMHFDKPDLPDTYEDVLGTLKNMADVVDTLYEKAKQAV